MKCIVKVARKVVNNYVLLIDHTVLFHKFTISLILFCNIYRIKSGKTREISSSKSWCLGVLGINLDHDDDAIRNINQESDLEDNVDDQEDMSDLEDMSDQDYNEAISDHEDIEIGEEIGNPLEVDKLILKEIIKLFTKSSIPTSQGDSVILLIGKIVKSILLQIKKKSNMDEVRKFIENTFYTL